MCPRGFIAHWISFARRFPFARDEEFLAASPLRHLFRRDPFSRSLAIHILFIIRYTAIGERVETPITPSHQWPERRRRKKYCGKRECEKGA